MSDDDARSGPGGPDPATGFNPYAAPEALGRPIEPGPEDAGRLAVTFCASGEEIAEFLRIHAASRHRLMRGIALAAPAFTVLAIYGLMLLAVSTSFAYRYRFLNFYLNRWRFGLLALVWAGVIEAAGLWANRRMMRGLARKQESSAERTVELSPAGVTVKVGDRTLARRSRASVPKVAHTDRLILLYDTRPDAENASAQVIPRRAFPTPEAALAFLRSAERWAREPQAAGEVAASGPGPGPDVPGTLTVAFAFTAEERRRLVALGRHARRHESRGVMIRAAIHVGFAAFCAARLVRELHRPGIRWQWVAVYVSVLLPILLSLPLLARLLWRALARGRLASDAGAITSVTISPEGYVIREPGGKEVARSWVSVPGVEADDTFLKLVSQITDARRRTAQVHLIPRRAFSSPEAAEEFLRSARRWHAEARDAASTA